MAIRGGFRLAPEVIQAPDVAFVREARRGDISPDRYCEFGPDLAVEILSPDDISRPGRASCVCWTRIP